MSLLRDLTLMVWNDLGHLLEETLVPVAALVGAGALLSHYAHLPSPAVWLGAAGVASLAVVAEGLAIVVDDWRSTHHSDTWDNDGLLVSCSDPERHASFHAHREDAVVHR